MNLDYILKEIRKADKIIVRAYNHLIDFNEQQTWLCLKKSKEMISQADEILSNLQISFEIWKEKEDEQLQQIIE